MATWALDAKPMSTERQQPADSQTYALKKTRIVLGFFDVLGFSKRVEEGKEEGKGSGLAL